MSPGPFDVDLERLRRRRTVKWSLYGPDVLAAWVAEMDFDIADPIRVALHDAVDRDDLGYVEADLSELTGACAGFLRDTHGWDVSPARIFPVADVLVGIAGALDVFVADGARVVVPTPAYPPFFEIVELGGREVVPAPMIRDDAGRFRLDLDRIDAELVDGARAVLLCSPHNPTGRVFDIAELTALATIIDRHGARVIADEVHAPLAHPGYRHVPYASMSEATAGHTVTIAAASKAWNLAGLKCAQVVMTNHADASRWRKLPVFGVAGPTPLGVTASTAAYSAGVPWLHDLVDLLHRNTDLMGELLSVHLPGVVFAPPEATFLAWLDCSALDLADPADHFLRHGGVALSDGPPFGAGNEQFVRLNFATSPELLERIVQAMGESVP